MARLIKAVRITSEGQVLNAWFRNRMLRRNQNVLIATTGGTGSGKSYVDLRIAELWYKEQFGELYPASINTCFSIGALMKLLASGKLKKGSLIVFEEAGANYGSLDFQQQVSKMFTYVLQSFRSMNVGILFNLPVLSMLNKSARLLIHAHFITAGINYDKKTSKVRPYFRQVNQQTGKVYEKYLRVRENGRVRTVKKFNFNLPHDDIIKEYEAMKFKFVAELSEEFANKLDEIDKQNLRIMARNELTDNQKEAFELLLSGLDVPQISQKLNLTQRAVYYLLQRAKKRGYEWKKVKKSLGNEQNEVQKPILAPI